MKVWLGLTDSQKRAFWLAEFQVPGLQNISQGLESQLDDGWHSTRSRCAFPLEDIYVKVWPWGYVGADHRS